MSRKSVCFESVGSSSSTFPSQQSSHEIVLSILLRQIKTFDFCVKREFRSRKLIFVQMVFASGT